MEKILDDFISIVGSPIYSEPVPENIIEKYRGLIMGPDDQDDFIIELWEKHGFSGYKDGLFWLVNPDEFNPLAWSFEEISDKAIVFARSATGNLFLWEWVEVLNRPNIVFYNVHTRTLSYMSNSITFFFNFDIGLEDSWYDDFYGEIEIPVVEKFGPIQSDEAIVYVPALALGGDESLENMEPQKVIPHLKILSQL